MPIKPIKLTDVTMDIEIAPEGCNTYYDKRTGELHPLGDDEWMEADSDTPLEDFPDWQRGTIEAARAVEEGSDDYICLPSSDEVDDYEIMEDFCRSVANHRDRERLLEAIQGRGAFGRFRDSVERLNLTDSWYAYRAAELARFAREWCEDNDIPYVDDAPKPELSVTATVDQFYEDLAGKLKSLFGDERNLIACAANMAALVYHELEDVNWVGFYFVDENELVLGPFQGKPACVRIGLAKGVCGAAARMLESLVVDNVHEFPGHIACDADSKSELVVPILQGDRLLGVFDIDSPMLARFDGDDRSGVQRLVAAFVEQVEKG